MSVQTILLRLKGSDYNISQMAFFSTHHLKNHEKARQKHPLPPTISKIFESYSRPSVIYIRYIISLN